ncbi:hypothetical protein EDD11_004480 [Mortierella claussenii]|nr:hypothetical protein EDD11_004480 [Mortierella claussenii]
MAYAITSPNTSNRSRISECEVTVTAVKVRSPYERYINHPFNTNRSFNTHDGDVKHNLKEGQPFITKYNNYTNSSRAIQLITIPSKNISSVNSKQRQLQQDAKGHHLWDLSMNSPTSPLVSPPPPYLPSVSAGEVESTFKYDSKIAVDLEPQPRVAQPRLARTISPVAIPVVQASATEEQMMEAELSSSPKASYRMAEIGQNDIAMTSSAQAVSSPSAAAPLSNLTELYPTFWQAAYDSNTHYYVWLPFGCVTLGCSIWMMVAQVFLPWFPVIPALGFLCLAVQFGAPQHSPELHVRFQEPFDQRSHKQPPHASWKTTTVSQQQQPRRQQMQYSPASTLVSTTSHPRSGPNNKTIGVNNGSPFYQDPNFLSPTHSPQTPPPAYFFSMKRMQLSLLPEINSVGDLVGEFSVDVDAIRY